MATLKDVAQRAGVTVTTVSVSYTHLDVYKRQASCFCPPTPFA